MSLKEFEIGKEIGKGAFGSVCFVKRKEDSKMYAMKKVKISQLNTKERENALNEVRILASLNHENIVGYKEAFFDEESKTLCIVMDFCDDGDLDSKIQKNIKSKGLFKENDIWKWLHQLLMGLKYLHDNKIMHRDLKCANIFLMKNGMLKLGDLNVSKIVKMGMCSTQTGTPYYASPEVWGDKPYDYKSDLWSLGCIVYELCSLKPPFRGQNLEQLYRNVTKGIYLFTFYFLLNYIGVYDRIPSGYSKDLSDIIGMMLQVNPMKRPTTDELLKNDILIKKINNLGVSDKFENQQKIETPMTLLGTIKLPKNMNEINQRLPKKKMYNQEK
jgi:NIMA (never in mitosis gene a)-related kinase